MNTPEWIHRSVSLLMPEPAGPGPRSTRERLRATLRKKEEALSPRVLRQTLADLRLVICEPNYVRQLEPDYCCDELPDDGDVPDEVAEAMEAFNTAVAGIVLSWSPGKKALALPDEGHNAI